jgi:hypothetical protein
MQGRLVGLHGTIAGNRRSISAQQVALRAYNLGAFSANPCDVLAYPLDGVTANQQPYKRNKNECEK